MNIIKTFNNKLNTSLKRELLKSNSFKEKIDIVLKSTILKNTNFKQALILGAGKMDDFNVSFFMKYFGKVLVTDIDLESMRQSTKQMKISALDRKKLILEEVEYTGFGENRFFEDFRSSIYKCHSFDEIENFLNAKLQKIHNYTFLKEKQNQFDFIYVSPIYTQLIYNQVLLECSLLRESGYQENLIKYIENVMLDEMVNIIDRFNDNIVHLLSGDGTLFVLSDIFEVNVGSSFSRRIISSIDSRDVMDSIYEQYQEEYGMGLGDFGLYNLDEKVKAVTYKWFIWPLNKDRNLIVKLKIYKNSSIHKEVVL